LSHDSGAPRREKAVARAAVIARSASDEAIHLSLHGEMDCFVALLLAMTS